jgi:hypothetical protein
MIELNFYESALWNTGIRPVFVDNSYLVIIEGAYR